MNGDADDDDDNDEWTDGWVIVDGMTVRWMDGGWWAMSDDDDADDDDADDDDGKMDGLRVVGYVG